MHNATAMALSSLTLCLFFSLFFSQIASLSQVITGIIASLVNHYCTSWYFMAVTFTYSLVLRVFYYTQLVKLPRSTHSNALLESQKGRERERRAHIFNTFTFSYSEHRFRWTWHSHSCKWDEICNREREDVYVHVQVQLHLSLKNELKKKILGDGTNWHSAIVWWSVLM